MEELLLNLEKIKMDNTFIEYINKLVIRKVNEDL